MGKHLNTEGYDLGLLEDFDSEEDLTSYLQCKFGCAELCDIIVRAIDNKLAINDREL